MAAKKTFLAYRREEIASERMFNDIDEAVTRATSLISANSAKREVTIYQAVKIVKSKEVPIEVVDLNG